MKFVSIFAVLALAAIASAQVPPEWTCSPAIYDGGDACDCDCGAYDLDCDTISFTRGCRVVEGSVSFCDDQGVCNFVVREVPPEWFCEDIDYDHGDGICNCGCGAIDPDCENPTSVAECPAGLNPSCTAEGACEYEAPLPDGWVCSGYAYDTQDGCDCSCGIPDPDCEIQSLEVFNCPCEEMNCIEGYCAGFCDGNMLFVTDTTAARDVPQVKSVPIQERFRIDHADLKMPGVEMPENNADLPFFSRNHINREVHPSTLKRYIHTTHPSEHVKNMLVQWGLFDPKQTDVHTIARRAPIMAKRAARETPPPEWTCNAAFFGTLDGCDCECGAHDPDCDVNGQTIFGCDFGGPIDGNFRPTCNAQDTCEFNEIVIPDEWRCDPDFYAFADGCDCQCGVYDPDCDQDDQIIFNCNQGNEPSCTLEAACEYGVVIPEGWTCPFFFYDDGVCDCNCGADDPDCADSQAEIFGCGSCGDGEIMSCESGFCVGSCNGVFLSLEVLEYWNPILGVGAPDIEPIDYNGSEVEYSELYEIAYNEVSASEVTAEGPVVQQPVVEQPDPASAFSVQGTFSASGDDSDDSTFTGGRLDARSSSQSSGAILSAPLGLLAVAAVALL